MLNTLEGRLSTLSGDMKDIQMNSKNEKKMQCLGWKNRAVGINSSLDIAAENNSEHEDTEIKKKLFKLNTEKKRI